MPRIALRLSPGQVAAKLLRSWVLGRPLSIFQAPGLPLRNLSCHIGETILCTLHIYIYTHYGNLISSSLTAAQAVEVLQLPGCGLLSLGLYCLHSAAPHSNPVSVCTCVRVVGENGENAQFRPMPVPGLRIEASTQLVSTSVATLIASTGSLDHQ